MHLSEIHFVVAKDAKGKVTALYVGEDAGAAEAKYEGAAGDLDIVGILNFPQFSRQRHPQADAIRAEEMASAALSATEVAQKKREIAASNLRAQAKDILAKAEQLHPTETQPEQTQPEQTQPEQTQPEQTQPEKSDPNQLSKKNKAQLLADIEAFNATAADDKKIVVPDSAPKAQLIELLTVAGASAQ